MGAFGKYKLHRKLPINNLFFVQDLPDTKEMKNRFQIVSDDKSFVVWAQGSTEKKEWLDGLYASVTFARKNKVGNDNVGGVMSRPVWASNDSAKSCACCERDFSLLNTGTIVDIVAV